MASTLIVSPYHGLERDPPPGPWSDGEWPAVTVVVAAWNEEQAIEATLERLAATTYLAVVLADNNSTDRTAELAEAAAARLRLDYRRVFEGEPGKFHALNRVLAMIETPLVVTLDADTYLYPGALSYLIARVTERPQDQHVCACAGAIVVENARSNFLTRMQQ
jgi:biofilm PGA synthesis N-glycosyltransferase PgaC